jgi:hypothetical protein
MDETAVNVNILITEVLSTVSTFKMPKVKCSDSVRLGGFVKEFGEKYFTTDGIILFCKLCEVKVTARIILPFATRIQSTK